MLSTPIGICLYIAANWIIWCIVFLIQLFVSDYLHCISTVVRTPPYSRNLTGKYLLHSVSHWTEIAIILNHTISHDVPDVSLQTGRSIKKAMWLRDSYFNSDLDPRVRKVRALCILSEVGSEKLLHKLMNKHHTEKEIQSNPCIILMQQQSNITLAWLLVIVVCEISCTN